MSTAVRTKGNTPVGRCMGAMAVAVGRGNMLNKVYIVHQGSEDEGGSTKMVCSTHEKAVWYAKWLARNPHGGNCRRKTSWDWRYKRTVPIREYYGKLCKWQQDMHVQGDYCDYPRIHNDYWKGRGDFIQVYQKRVW